MKRLLYIVLPLLIAGCSSDSAWDCVKTAGDINQEEVFVDDFSKIEVYHRVQLFIEHGETQKVVLETGENLRNEISITVTDGKLTIKNYAACNMFREYGVTKVYVTSPNIYEIRNSSSLAVKSIGVLRFPQLTLLSENTSGAEVTHTNGDFHLHLEIVKLFITANGKANYFLSGSANEAFIGLHSGDSRFEGRDFIVQYMDVYHRSSNHMFVNPQQLLRGEIRSTGNIYSYNIPPIVEVEQFYTGSLIFQ